jgi:hypothetical protein
MALFTCLYGENVFWLKRHNNVLAVADQEVLGKVFRDNGVVLDLRTHAQFYKGELVSAEQVLAAARSPDVVCVNVVGNRAVRLFQSVGWVEHVLEIGGVKHAQLYFL